MSGDQGGEARAVMYRRRAEELRAVAALLRDHRSQELILSTADDYERMARALERVAASHRTNGSSESSD
jgi:hypothetical protein